jgi:hypothetical protein
MSKMRAKIFSCFVFMFQLILSSCEKIDIGESFVGKVDDKIRITSNLSFTIRSVLDWRCPIDMECVSSGDVNTYIRFHQLFHHTDTVIYLYSGGRNPIEFGSYSFKVLEVNPLPKSDIVIPQDDFRIKMLVLKN